MRVKKDVLLELKNLKPIIATYKYFYEGAVLYVEKIQQAGETIKSFAGLRFFIMYVSRRKHWNLLFEGNESSLLFSKTSFNKNSFHNRNISINIAFLIVSKKEINFASVFSQRNLRDKVHQMVGFGVGLRFFGIQTRHIRRLRHLVDAMAAKFVA